MGAVEMHSTWRRAHPNVNRIDLGNSGPAHDNPGFLPWHRQFCWSLRVRFKLLILRPLPYYGPRISSWDL
ncbi:hypothetical protein PILCRDRAFT_822701 [Piloderma croceum F 1598]|uniref:Tyrosinase copper-binding domain-containing protein n=1 Tax=Piloderma croceum (strain F 1598) TaxID=765440 RepID=A0A0C3F6D7_PILCF|nr:hypothetical protein PILCRDRAFT_822701 [Piloderma croceum F 1598]